MGYTLQGSIGIIFKHLSSILLVKIMVLFYEPKVLIDSLPMKEC